MAGKIIRTAICSYGMSGFIFHAPFIHRHPGFYLSKILERNRSDSRDRYSYSRIVRNYEEILRDPEIDLVVVNTPDHYHYSMAKEALSAGKHVIVEKPFTQFTYQAEELIQLAKTQGRILSVYHNRRFDGDSLTVQKILREGSLGRIIEYEAHYDRYRPQIVPGWKEKPETGASILYNLGSHLIDHVLFLFGKPREIWAKLGKMRDGALTDDYFEIKMIYPRMLASLKASYLVKEPGPRYILHGTMGSFIKSGSDPQEEALKKGLLPEGKDWGKENPNDWGLLHTVENGKDEISRPETLAGNYMNYYDNIYKAITEGESLKVTAAEGLQVIKIIEAAIASDKEGRNIKIN